MKILFIGAATSTHTKRWINALAERGHDVLLVCRGDQRGLKEEISDKVKIHYLRFGGGLGYYLNVLELRLIYKKNQPDIVNAHYATGYATLARLAGARPLVVSCWGSDVFSFPYKSNRNMALIRKNLLCADAVASTSIAMAEQVKKLVKDSEFNVTVTPFGVDINKFAPLRDKRQEKRLNIGIVKYLEPIYDIPLLIKAFALVCNKTETRPTLSIYGDGTLRYELEKLAESLGVKEDVSFYGTIPNTEIPNALQTMDIFVNCSRQESFGVAIVEAMACELPVIATDTEGFREVVDDGITGIILKDREPETMAKEILNLMSNESLRLAMGKAGREKVLNLYNWQNNIDIMERLYLDVYKR